jgi:hypothetical protein
MALDVESKTRRERERERDRRRDKEREREKERKRERETKRLLRQKLLFWAEFSRESHQFIFISLGIERGDNKMGILMTGS